MTPSRGDFWRIGFPYLCPFGFPLGFPYFIICIYCYARTGSLRSRVLSLDILVFDTLYIYDLALAYPLLVTLSFGVLRFRVTVFVYPFFFKGS